MNRFPFLFIYGTECNVITLQFLLQMETKELFPIPQRYIPALIWLKGAKQRDIVTVSGITKLVLKRTREEMGQVHISGKKAPPRGHQVQEADKKEYREQ